MLCKHIGGYMVFGSVMGSDSYYICPPRDSVPIDSVC